MKESHENMELLLEKIQYEKYNLLFCLACSLATQNFVALCVSGIVGTENIITSKNSGLKGNHLKCRKYSIN